MSGSEFDLPPDLESAAPVRQPQQVETPKPVAAVTPVVKQQSKKAPGLAATASNLAPGGDVAAAVAAGVADVGSQPAVRESMVSAVLALCPGVAPQQIERTVDDAVDRLVQTPALMAALSSRRQKTLSSFARGLALVARSGMSLDPHLQQWWMFERADEIVVQPGVGFWRAWAASMGYTIRTHIVWSGDTDRPSLSASGEILFPSDIDWDGPSGEITGAVAAAYRGGDYVAGVVLRRGDIERHRSASKSAGSGASPWKLHPAQMAERSAVVRLCRILPKDVSAKVGGVDYSAAMEAEASDWEAGQ